MINFRGSGCFEGPQKGKPRQGLLVKGVGQMHRNLQHRGDAVPADQLELEGTGAKGCRGAAN